MAEKKVIRYAGNQQIYNKSAVDNLLKEKQDKLNYEVYSKEQVVALLKKKQDKLPIDIDPEDPAGIDDLKIILAGVQVGGTMFWPIAEKEVRTLKSDSPFKFEFNDQQYSVEVPDDEVELLISKNEPENWWPLNGKAELRCEDFPYLAKFFGGTRNDDGTWNADGNNVADDWVDGKSTNAKIWLPYVRQSIIKARY